MPYDGTGVYRPLLSPTFPAVGGTVIQADHYNAVINDIAAGLTNAVKRDGQGPWTGAQNAGGKKITNLGEGTLDADATTLKQLRDLVASGTGTLTTNTMVAPAAGEARVGATYTGLEPVYLFSNSVSYGLYSTTGGVLIDYERATGKKRLGGTIDIATLVKNDSGTYGINISGNAATASAATTATTAATATTATTATTAATATNALQLGGIVAASYALKTDTAPNSLKFAGMEIRVGVTTGSANCVFSTPFPNACLHVISSHNTTDAGAAYGEVAFVNDSTVTRFGFSFMVGTVAAHPYHYIAFGN